MAQFRYRAVDRAGRPVAGLRQANTLAEGIAQLQEQGLIVIEMRASSTASWFGKLRQRRPLSGAKLAQFTQQFAVLIQAGQPIDRALATLLSLATAGSPGAQMIARIRDAVKGGRPLSSALAEENGQFPPLYLAMVRAGEAGGELAETLASLALYLERAMNLRGSVGNALIYPAFLLVGVVGSIALLLAYVVPEFVPIFNEMNVPLPWITQWVLTLGAALQQGWWAILLIALALTAVARALLSQPEKRLRWDQRLLKWRVIGPLVQQLESARLTRTLGTLLRNGVPLLQALTIARQTCTNHAIVAAVDMAIERVKSGNSLARTLASAEVLPTLAVQMIQVGEDTATLDAMLLKAADFFDTESKRSIDRLLAALTPTLTVVMSVLVGGIMMAIMLPLMDMTNNI